MKYIYILLGLLCFSANLFGQGIKFEKIDLATALKVAEREQKMVFIDAYAVWCTPCHKMDTTVFKDKEIGAYFSKHVVSLKIDVERGEGKQIKKKYAIEGLPGYVFLDAKGDVVHREKGAKSAAVFMDLAKQAYASMLDTNSVGRLAARYLQEKNNEQFLALYLQKLLEARATGYTDVLEQYLSVQKNIATDSKAMAKLIDDHNRVLIFGSKADEIIQKNLKSDGWQSYVRKDVRQRFQDLSKKMAQTTTDYAVEKKDISYIDVALARSKDEGLQVSENQRELLMMYYYKKNSMGVEFKALVFPQIEAAYNSLNVDLLYKQHLDAKKKFESEQPGRVFRTNAMIEAQKLSALIKDYAPFVRSDKEKENVLKWAKKVYGLTSENDGLNFYANALYLFGDKQEGIKLKAEVCEKANDSRLKASVLADYELMLKSQPINL